MKIPPDMSAADTKYEHASTGTPPDLPLFRPGLKRFAHVAAFIKTTDEIIRDKNIPFIQSRCFHGVIYGLNYLGLLSFVTELPLNYEEYRAP